jgi:mannose-6-phosphate isomerase-like protein (cupin superfamily)
MAPVRKVNLLKLLENQPPRANFHVLEIDRNYTVRVARTAGRFPWHYHPNGDEGWFVFEGRLRIEMEDGAVELERGDFTTIPRGVRHSPEALVPGTIIVIFNLRELGMVLDDPEADLGGFRESDLTRPESQT